MTFVREKKMVFGNDFSRKISVCVLTFLCHGLVGGACANTFQNYLNQQTNISNSIILEHIRNISESTGPAAKTITLCSEGAGYYVAACGNYRLGFNWLKSANVPDPTTVGSDNYQYTTTKNYYVSDDLSVLYEQMRTFFGHSGSGALIKYVDANNHVVLGNNYGTDRQAILNNICTPSNIKCERCPNNANVEESTVQLDVDNRVLSNGWDIYTFADCYMQQFEDTTGTYFYVPENETINNVNSSNAKKCYYTNEIPNSATLSVLNGDEIGTFVPGVTRPQISVPQQITSGNRLTR